MGATSLPESAYTKGVMGFVICKFSYVDMAAEVPQRPPCCRNMVILFLIKTICELYGTFAFGIMRCLLLLAIVL